MPSLRLARALVAALALLTLASCGEESDGAPATEDKAQTRTFEADNGSIEIPADPQRVVATGYAVPEMIEADAPLVGRSSWQRGLPLMSAEGKQRYEETEQIAGELAAETDYEAIAEVEPDLILVGVPAPVLGDINMERLESLAPTLAIGPSLPDDWRELSRRYADAAGVLDQYDERKAAYEEKAASLKDKYADALAGMKFGHVGAYGEVARGQFHREFAGSWGTNIAQDIGVEYPGEVQKKSGGSSDVSEYPSIEDLPKSLGEADAISYSVNADGSVPEAVQYVLDSPLWKSLPAVEAGNVFAFRYTEAATYGSAMKTLEALDKALAPLLDD
jgi:iron complex transport system substrate-binding protein